MNLTHIIHEQCRPSASLPYLIAADKVVEETHSAELRGVAPRCTQATVEVEGVLGCCEARRVLPLE
jgi:hypothetical protein